MKNHLNWLFACVLWAFFPVVCIAQLEDAPSNVKNTPFGFVENKGQLVDQFSRPNPAVLYQLGLGGLNVQLKARGFSYDTYVQQDDSTLGFHRVDVAFIKANAQPTIIAGKAAADYITYYTANSEVVLHHFDEVLYQNIYDGIDLVFKAMPGSNKGVEYDFIVHPGADASQIQLQYSGAFDTKLENEKVNLFLMHGVLSENIPESFLKETKQSIAVSYQQVAPNIIGFQIPDYDKSKTLVIDPNPDRAWATYYGGTLSDQITAVAVDASGNVYITGETSSTASIASTGAHQTTLSTATDAFIAKFNASGVRQWATYYGGNGNDTGESIAVDASANVYVAGYTGSTNNIATTGAFKTTLSGTSDAFLVKFNTSGARQFGTYFGGAGTESATALTVNGTTVYFGGQTTSATGVESISAFLLTLQGGAYLASFTTAGVRNWSTYYPGTRVWAIAVDGSGNVVFGGETTTTQAGLATTHQTTFGGGVSDGFLVKFTSAGNRSWGTYFGGNNQDRIRTIDTDANNSIFAGGYTASITSGISTGSEIFGQLYNGGTSDGFIAKFSSTGVQELGMYIGTNANEEIFSLNVRPDNSIYFGGRTNGAYATTDAYQTTNGGSNDMFVGKFDPNFSNYGSPNFPRLWATNYGGSGAENLFSMATSGTSTNTRVYLAGNTTSTSNVASTGAHQTTLGGSVDGLLVAFTDCGIPGRAGAITSTGTYCAGQSYTFTVGTTYNATSYEWVLPSGWTGSSTTNSITVTINGGGTISVRGVNSCGNGTYSSLTVTTNPLPVQPGLITGNISVCQGTVQTYSIAPVAGATSYTWTFPSGWSGSSTTTTVNVTVGPNSGAVSVTANNICGSGIARSIPTVGVTPLPVQPSAIIGDDAVCLGASKAYGVTNVVGNTYAWTLPAGWSGSSTTNGITATVGSNTGTISVTASNACGTSPAQTKAITSVSLGNPSQPGTITGNAIVCAGSSQTYIIAPVGGATSYNWNVSGTGWSGTSTTTSFTPTVGTGNATINVTANNVCGGSAVRSLSITTNAVPAQPSAINSLPDDFICSGTSRTYSVTNVAGLTYNWTLPSGWTGTSTSNSITVTAGANSGTISVTGTNGCGTSSARTLPVTVGNVPAIPTVSSAPNPVCLGAGATYSVNPVAGGDSYTWSLPSGWSGSSVGPSITVTVGTSGNISVTANNTNCGSSAPLIIPVTVNSVPAQPSAITGSITPSQGVGTPYSVTNVPATNYTWTAGANSSVTGSGNAVNISWSASGARTISVTPSNGCGNGTASTLAVTVGGGDVTPPSITSLLPADNATNVSTNSNLVVTFSENIIANSGTITIRNLANNAIVQSIPITDGAVSISGNTLTINPNDFTTGTEYYVDLAVSLVRDAAGNFFGGLNGNPNWTFTTAKQDQTIAFSALVTKTFGDANFNLSATASSGLPVSYASSNASVATIIGNTVTIVGAGSTTITASQAGNATFNAATNVQQTLTVNKANQTITFGALAAKTFGDANFTLGATASSALGVSYSSSNTAVATVSGNTVTIVGAGSTIITASQSGNANFNAAANVQQTLTVNKANQTITFGTLPGKQVGDAAFGLTAAASSGLAVSYTSSNAAVATVSGSTVTIAGVGTTTITASQSGNVNYNAAASVNQSLTVTAAAPAMAIQSLSPSDNSTNVNVGTNLAITFNQNVSIGAGTISVHRVDNDAVITSLSNFPAEVTIAGATITFNLPLDLPAGTDVYVNVTAGYLRSAADGSNTFAGIGNKTTWNFTTAKQDQTITFSALTPKTFGDANFNLSATASSGLPVSYASSNISVATVSGNTVTIVGAGSTTITASQAGNANFNAATNVQQTLTVNKANQTITFSALAAKTFGDTNFTLSASASSSLAVSYSSSNPSVATVSGNTVTIVGAGSTTITASQAGNANFNAATNVQQTLTVNKANQTITFSALAAKTFGDTNFTLSASASSSLAVIYSSSNTSVATVSGSTVTIVGAGSTTITASQTGNANFNAATNVQQTLTVNKANQTITFSALAAKTFGDANFTLSASTSSSLAVSYSSSNTSVATVSGNTVTIVGAGSTTITASQAGNSNYNAATNVQQALTVNKANQAITFNDIPAKTVGDPSFILTATANSGLSVSFVSSNTAVATVSGNTVTIVGTGSTIITASQSGNTNYNAATPVDKTLIVSNPAKQNQTITFNALAAKTFGDANFSLSATASSGLTVSYSSSNTSVATVAGNTVTIIGAGSTVITANQAGNDAFNPAPAVQQTLTVNKANQTITFNTLPAKTFGDAAFTLSATSSASLSISYTSSNSSVATVSGNTVTIIGVGTTTITAAQGGNANFNAASSVGRVLTVNKADQTITFGSIAARSVGDPPFSLNASASSGLAVSYTSSNTAVATVSGSTVTIVGIGNTTITASQTGNANFNAATAVQQILTVTSQTRIINLSGDMAFGELILPETKTKALTITNTGSATLTITNITFPEGYSGDKTSGTIASGANLIIQVKLTPTAAQEYNGTITITSDATSGSNTISVTGKAVLVTGLEPTMTNRLKAYPNPSAGIIEIEVAQLEKEEALVCDQTGKLALTVPLQRVDENRYTLEILNEAQGIYFIKVQTKSGMKTARVMKIN